MMAAEAGKGSEDFDVDENMPGTMTGPGIGTAIMRKQSWNFATDPMTATAGAIVNQRLRPTRPWRGETRTAEDGERFLKDRTVSRRLRNQRSPRKVTQVDAGNREMEGVQHCCGLERTFDAGLVTGVEE